MASQKSVRKWWLSGGLLPLWLSSMATGGVALLLVDAIAPMVALANAAVLSDWQFNPTTNQLEITVQQGTTPRYFMLAQPARLVVELPKTQVGSVPKTRTFSGPVRQIQVVQFQPEVTRIVMELSSEVVLEPDLVNLQSVPASGTETAGNRWVVSPLFERGAIAVNPRPSSVSSTSSSSSSPANAAKPSTPPTTTAAEPTAPKPTASSPSSPDSPNRRTPTGASALEINTPQETATSPQPPQSSQPSASPAEPSAKPVAAETNLPSVSSTADPAETPVAVAKPPTLTPAAPTVTAPTAIADPVTPVSEPAAETNTPPEVAQPKPSETPPRRPSPTPPASTTQPTRPTTTPTTPRSETVPITPQASASSAQSTQVTAPQPELETTPSAKPPEPSATAIASPTPATTVRPEPTSAQPTAALPPATFSRNQSPSVKVPPLGDRRPANSNQRENSSPETRTPSTPTTERTTSVGSTLPPATFSGSSSAQPPVVKVPPLGAPQSPSASPTVVTPTVVNSTPSESDPDEPEVGRVVEFGQPLPESTTAPAQLVLPLPPSSQSTLPPLEPSNPTVAVPPPSSPSPANGTEIDFQPPTVTNVAANSNALLPAGTLLSLQYSGTETLELKAGVPQQEALVLQTELRDRAGNLIAPAGTPVIGRFETGSGGSRFIAQAIALQGRNVPLVAESGAIGGDRQVSDNQVLRNSAIGALAGALIGGLGEEAAVGAAAGAAITYFTAPQPAKIQPGQIVEIRLTEDLQ